ncbi:MAG: SPFH domain-containing protein [Segniliparus sp.]|uniref:SPFH domain-containing protein n=1 Tax=Segniliparus sp. TaxID=2804064 RepID=UPI003F327683
MSPTLGIAVLVVAIVVLLVAFLRKTVLLVPQSQAAIVERLGRYSRTVSAQLTLLAPFVDQVRARVDLRERVIPFPPQPVITADNLTVLIDTVVYVQVTKPESAVYEIENYIVGVEQLAATTIRNVVGGMTLEAALTSREVINSQLRGVLDEATGPWGIRVARVELRSIDPPPSVQESMEKQMKADREKRATILAAEGQREAAIQTAQGSKQAQVLAAEGAKQAQVLAAEGAKLAAILAAEADRQANILRAEGERAGAYLRGQGEAKSLEKVLGAIKAAQPTPELLAYQYVQALGKVAQGEANKVWVLPTDFGGPIQAFSKLFGTPAPDGSVRYQPSPPERDPVPVEHDSPEIASWFKSNQAFKSDQEG